MKKRVFIIHGWEGSPEEPMFMWLKTELEAVGFEVTIPTMPNPELPQIKSWLKKIKETVTNPNDQTYFIGHSVGCQAILRYLETLPDKIQVAGVVLVVPWMELDAQTIKEEGPEVVEEARPWMESPIYFGKVRAHLEKAVAIFSDNDPYIRSSQQDLFKDKIGAEIILEPGKGHFDRASGINELPSARDAILEMAG